MVYMVRCKFSHRELQLHKTKPLNNNKVTEGTHISVHLLQQNAISSTNQR